MCSILKVKGANYYKWLHHEKSGRDLENEELATYIKRYDEMFDHTLGYRIMCDRINRDFNVSKPNEKWVGDVTEIKYGKHNEHKLYLSRFLDLYDRTVVGYKIDDYNDNPLIFKTLDMAIANNPNVPPLVHSDGGYQYTSPTFINRLKEHGMTQSMSRVHCCIDNGPI